MDGIKPFIKGPQDNKIMKDLKNAYYWAKSASFIVATKPGFFLSLNPLPGGRDMLLLAKELTGNIPHILTAPLNPPNDKRCAEEKYEWIKGHFDGLFDGFHCTNDKKAFGNPYSILVDDRTKYIDGFRENGGRAIQHTDAAITIPIMKEMVGAG